MDSVLIGKSVDIRFRLIMARKRRRKIELAMATI